MSGSSSPVITGLCDLDLIPISCRASACGPGPGPLSCHLLSPHYRLSLVEGGLQGHRQPLRVQRFSSAFPPEVASGRSERENPAPRGSVLFVSLKKAVFSSSSLTPPWSAWEPGPRGQRHLQWPEAGFPSTFISARR